MYNDIANRIAALISPIENVGHVYTFRRYVSFEDKFLDLFEHEATDSIRAWQITRIGRNDLQTGSRGTNTIEHEFIIEGYLTLSDERESEIIFQELVDTIIDAFRPQTNLTTVVELHRPAIAEEIGYRFFGNFFCHYARIAISIQEHKR